MISPLSIWQENRATFGGGGRDWSNRQVLIYYIIVAVSASVIALITSRPSDNLFNAVLTAVSIIAGFTFNALLFLADGKFKVVNDPSIMEQQARQNKVNRLAKSSFSVIYYFNIISILVVISSVIALLGPSLGEKIPKSYNSVLHITELLGRAIFFAVLMETGVTFYRALRRLKYLFDKIRTIPIE